MFSVASARLPRREIGLAASASAAVHTCILAGLVLRMAGAPAPTLRQATVTYFDLAAPSEGPPAPVPSRASVAPPPVALALPDLRLEANFAMKADPLAPSINPQEINLSGLSGSLPLVRAAGPRTALPVLLNESEAEEQLHRRLGGVERADTVNLYILVDQNGLVRGARIGQSSGDPAFDRIASEVILGTGRFLPAHQGGVPLDVWVEFPVSVEPLPPVE